MAIKFNDWLADRQRLLSVVQNVLKLKKIPFEVDEEKATLTFDTGNMKGVEAFVNAKKTLETMGFKDQHGRAITSTENLSLSKNGKGLIETFTKNRSTIEVSIGTSYEYGTFDAINRFNEEQEAFMQKYEYASNLIEVLGHNNSDTQFYRKENSKKIILDLMKVGFKKIPNELKKGDYETCFFYDGIFIFCYPNFKITWGESL